MKCMRTVAQGMEGLGNAMSCCIWSGIILFEGKLINPSKVKDSKRYQASMRKILTLHGFFLLRREVSQEVILLPHGMDLECHGMTLVDPEVMVHWRFTLAIHHIKSLGKMCTDLIRGSKEKNFKVERLVRMSTRTDNHYEKCCLWWSF